MLEKISIKIGETCPDASDVKIGPKLKAPTEAYSSERDQYHASTILEKVQPKTTISQEEKILVVTSRDLYSKNLNFVFGQAQCPGKVSIISTHRLRPKFYGQEKNQEIFLERAAKEAIHELGHTIGLGHCTNQECVMSFSNSIIDVDRKKLTFCEDCRKRANI
ncbi:hypothetical protein AKJ63_00270 [candidate division MSBL1 archaeon SCGC-AAA259D18]|uniref:Archaemetzincin n=1 Tax=candidate division MSBL1 archaeon SCGC-AAA259D18 TaxID=1698262 RepID=A0A133UCP5_9EURY|nr:hypothetical protein AKJ63_00270 [candidate division MSBL1 archaeon SCGC-AAA259D18]